MRPFSHVFLVCSLLLLVLYVRPSIGNGNVNVLHPVAFARRQDGENTASNEPTKTEDSTITDAPTRTADSTENATGDNSDRTTGSTETDTNSETTSEPKTTEIPFDAPPGGIMVVQPAITDGPTYIKIGTTATFKWNYTSLIVTPSAIVVAAYCSKNSHTYTISSNMTVDPTAEVTWDTSVYNTQNEPLLTEKYTLLVYDMSKSPTDPPQPGLLTLYNQLTFGMYSPQTDYVCSTCNAAMSDMDRQALKFMFGMAMITVLSFTWFVTGIGLLA
ncbi:hypothetical protein PAAG_06493 [Paracoccidioides lutzii Pb01]|uniref:DUF7137 domain-containing protein n=1 Tax=Paracoccidioides lutzii (strain ATCC MYA-826 / Pb01) TaxID=502779 RepID=C1H6V2_PARBA|nr:hypothetical protein PAAG_06493 [Paracoccidioides lutzii Pb01]EEH35446.1 hypothetical protein PAAG_06493 [Paracoccidioides lutzii Pb01]